MIVLGRTRIERSILTIEQSRRHRLKVVSVLLRFIRSQCREPLTVHPKSVIRSIRIGLTKKNDIRAVPNMTSRTEAHTTAPTRKDLGMLTMVETPGWMSRRLQLVTTLTANHLADNMALSRRNRHLHQIRLGGDDPKFHSSQPKVHPQPHQQTT
jgi:hypothetical protein